MSFIMRPIRFASTGHIIEGSGLFDGSTGYLSRTFGVAGNQKTFTIEAIVKYANTSSSRCIFSSGTSYGVSHDNSFIVEINGTVLRIRAETGGAAKLDLRTTQVFRDHAAFYHIVVSIDSTPATPGSSDCSVWINGTQVTAFTTETYPAQNQTFFVNGANEHRIGMGMTTNFVDGYGGRVTLIDGLALDPTSFGEVTSDGFWQINDASELTFGTNGFLIEGGDDVADGIDSSITPTPATYIPDAARFDGSGEYGTRTSALAGTSSSETLICGSVWLKFNDTGQSDLIFGLQGASGDSDHPFNIRRHSSTGSVALRVWKSGVAVYVNALGNANLDDGLWHHVAWNINLASGPTVQLYIDGVDAKDPASSASTGNFVGNSPNIGVGIDQRNSNQILNGDMADLWILFGENIDLSVPANLAKFITTDGQAVDLGSTGTNPNGSTPTIFMHLDSGETPNNWMTNAGDGGAITLAGTLTSTPLVPTRFGNSFYKSGTITATNDSPTNGGDDDEYGNYSTWNPVNLISGYTPGNVTYSDGNRVITNSAGAYSGSMGTLAAPSTGKWRYQFKLTSTPAVLSIGYRDPSLPSNGGLLYVWENNGYVKWASSNSGATGRTLASGDVIDVALDMDAGTLKFWRGGVVETTLNGFITDMITNMPVGGWVPFSHGYNFTAELNTGQTAWEYPLILTDHLPLATQNLPTPDVINYEDEYYIEAGISHSNGSTTAVTLPKTVSGGAMVRIKRTNTTGGWYVFDTVRGANKFLYWNDTAVEDTSTFDDQNLTGTTFTMPSDLATGTYLLECFYMGSYFQIKAYSGTGSAHAESFSAALDTAPGMGLVMARDATYNNTIYHISLGGTKNMQAQSAAAAETGTNRFNDTNPTASQFTLGDGVIMNDNSKTYIAYYWANSGPYAFGSATANASTDGPFISMPGSPQYLTWKNASAAQSWYTTVVPINNGNVMNTLLLTDATDAAYTSSATLDILSNGAKIRSNGGGTPNTTSGNTIITMAFGIQPMTDGSVNQGRAR